MTTRHPKYFTDMSESEIIEWLNSFETILVDCDGVLWYLYKAYNGVTDVINSLKKLKKRVSLVTNNSTKTRQEFKNIAQRLGFNIELEEIYCTAYLAALYLKHKKFAETAYIVGSEAIQTELNSVGISNFGVGVIVLFK